MGRRGAGSPATRLRVQPNANGSYAHPGHPHKGEAATVPNGRPETGKQVRATHFHRMAPVHVPGEADPRLGLSLGGPE